MALHPYLRGDDWFSYPTPNRIFDQHFGRGIFEHDPMLREAMQMMNTVPYWMRPRSVTRAGGHDTGMSEVISDKDKFEVNLDVSHFKPEELMVKTVDNTLLVTGKHEEKMDEHGFVSRQFSRKYMLPKDVDAATITSNLTADGIMTIKAPKKPAIAASNERPVPIQMASQPPAVTHK